MSSLQRRFVQIFALDPFYGEELYNIHSIGEELYNIHSIGEELYNIHSIGEELYNTIVCGSTLEKSNAYYEFPSISVTLYFCFHFIWSLYWLYFDSS